MRLSTLLQPASLVVPALLFAGCKGSADGKAGDAGVATAAPSSAAVVPAGTGCRAGTLRNADPPFCYKLPQGMKPSLDPIKKEGRYQLLFEGPGGAKISFIVWNPDAFEATWQALEGNAEGSKATDVKKEDLDAGKTRVLTFTTPGKDARSIVSYLTRGSKHALECEAEVPKGKPTDELLAACKQIHDP